MKDTFRGYYPPSDEEFERLWTEGTVVLDANALLHFFRYSAATRDELMDLLKKEQARLWLPHQVGVEFHRNRRGIAGQQRQAFADVETALEKARNSAQGAIDALGRHATQEATDLSSVLRKHDSKLRKELKLARRRHADGVTSSEAQNKTFEAVTELYERRVGKGYSPDELEKLFKEGAVRYAKQMPPGFADAKLKDGYRKYGDLIVWRQILDHAAIEKKPMLFIIDDGKEDWWEKADNQTFGPRPELVEEYYDACGERVHFYSVRRFLAYAKQRGEEISDASVEEARKVSRASDIQARAARRRLLQRLIDQVGDVQINSPEFNATTELSRRLLEEILSKQSLSNSPRLSDWVSATSRSRLALDDLTSRRVSEDALDFLENETRASVAAREMLRRDENAVNQLRMLGLLDEADNKDISSQRDHESDQED